jgi:integrase
VLCYVPDLSRSPKQARLRGLPHRCRDEARPRRLLAASIRRLAGQCCGAARRLIAARRNEILALRWSDLDVAASTLRIERAIEETTAHGRILKGPKTARGKRTIQPDRRISRIKCGRPHLMRNVASTFMWRPAPL